MILGLHIHIGSLMATTLVPVADSQHIPILCRKVTAD